MADISFATQTMKTAGTSPTGELRTLQGGRTQATHRPPILFGTRAGSSAERAEVSFTQPSGRPSSVLCGDWPSAPPSSVRRPHRLTACAGSLPAVEMKQGLGGKTPGSRDDLEAAQAAIDFLKRDTNLDGRLTGAAAAECVAFNCLIDTTLAEALRYSMWCEWASLTQLPVRPLPQPVRCCCATCCGVSGRASSSCRCAPSLVPCVVVAGPPYNERI